MAPIKKVGYWFAGGSTPANAFDSSLYTHLCFAFVDLNPSNFTVTVPGYAQRQIGSFVQTVRQKNGNVKTLISIGGGGPRRNEICRAFSRMAATALSRSAFIQSSIALAQSYNFDGLDLDWEYPGKSPGNPEGSEEDMRNFGLLLDELRRAAPQGFLLAAAVYYSNPLGGYWGGRSYPIDSIKLNLDWIFVMAYDLHGPGWETPDLINNPAPLYDNTGVCGDTGLTNWATYVDAKKIIYGLPTYGYAWKLRNPNSNHIGDLADGAADLGTGDTTIPYPRILQFIRANRATVVPGNGTVYAYTAQVWIGYDDDRSIAEKVQYVNNIQLGGYGFWTVDDALATAAAQAIRE